VEKTTIIQKEKKVGFAI